MSWQHQVWLYFIFDFEWEGALEAYTICEHIESIVLFIAALALVALFLFSV